MGDDVSSTGMHGDWGEFRCKHCPEWESRRMAEKYPTGAVAMAFTKTMLGRYVMGELQRGASIQIKCKRCGKVSALTFGNQYGDGLQTFKEGTYNPRMK